MSTLYVPGRGVVNLAARRVDRAVREYDERLFFARHPETGQWAIFIKIERNLPMDFGTVVEGQRAYPVLGFNEDPENLDIDIIKKKLYETDAMRHGTKMLDRIHEHNEKVREPYRAAASDAAGVVAEVVESYKHGQDETSYRRILRPKGAFGRTSVRGH